MVYGAILEKGEDYYTNLRKVFEAIKGKQNDYNWLITDCECYPDDENIYELFNKKYCFLSGLELTEIIEKENFQLIWGVLSGFKKDIPIDEILKYELPYADLNPNFWKRELSIQNKLADIEIIAFDGSLTMLISKEFDIVSDFRSFFRESRDLLKYNKEMISSMNMKKIKGIEKLTNIFDDNISFHDANVSHIKYDGEVALVTIDCKGFLKTLNLSSNKFRDLDNVVVTFKFRNISLFNIDFGYGEILDLNIDFLDNHFLFEIFSCGLKIECQEIELDEVLCISKNNENKYKNLDIFLKSNL